MQRALTSSQIPLIHTLTICKIIPGSSLTITNIDPSICYLEFHMGVETYALFG